jgi:hypothetical protein
MITEKFKEEVDGAINAATLWLVKEVLKKANITSDSLATKWQNYLRESKNDIVYSEGDSFYDKILTFARQANETLYGEFLTNRLGVSLSVHGESVSKILQDICTQSRLNTKYLPNLCLITVDFKIAGVIVTICGEQKQIYGSTKFSEDAVKAALGLDDGD